MVIEVLNTGDPFYEKKAVSSIASMLSLTKRLKTLILQVQSKDDYGIEHILIGKDKEIAGIISDSNKGIDALLREASNTKLTADLFDAYTEGVFETKNLLDIATFSAKKSAEPDFERACGKPLSVRMDQAKKDGISKADFKYLPMDMLLLEAIEVYDVIIAVLNNPSKALKAYFDDASDIKILVTPQMKKMDRHSYAADYLVIEDYDEESMFNARKVALSFDIRKVFYIPRNVAYDDAAKDGNLFDFIMHNKANKADDDNYEWTNKVLSLINDITGDKEVKEIPFFELETTYDGILLEEKSRSNEPVEVLKDSESPSKKMEETKKPYEDQKEELLDDLFGEPKRENQFSLFDYLKEDE